MSEFCGELRLLQRLNNYEMAVELDILRSGLIHVGGVAASAENQPRERVVNWEYRNLERYYRTFAGKPILVAYIGSRVGDGHNSQTQVDRETGERYESYMGATAERIVGMVSEDETDLTLVQRAGDTWVRVKGRIWTNYAPELTEKLLRTGRMSVSVETNVLESAVVDGVERMDVWEGLGVTILGDGVAPAVPGANVRVLAAMQSEFETMKLRVAALRETDGGPQPDGSGAGKRTTPHPSASPTPSPQGEGRGSTLSQAAPDSSLREGAYSLSQAAPDSSLREGAYSLSQAAPDSSLGEGACNVSFSKGVKSRMNKQLMRELAAKFPAHFVAGVSEDGRAVALLSRSGADAYSYTFEDSDKGTVVSERILPAALTACVMAGEREVEVDITRVTGFYDTEVARLTQENEALTERVNALEQAQKDMAARETARRIKASRDAAERQLAEINRNRAESDRFEDAIIDGVRQRAEAGAFAECVDAEGNWAGEEAVCAAVRDICMQRQMELDRSRREAQKNASQRKYAFEADFEGGETADPFEAMYASMVGAN